MLLTGSTLGAHDATDSQIMAYASANDCVVLTHDLDFVAILAASQGAAPIVVQIRAESVSPVPGVMIRLVGRKSRLGEVGPAAAAGPTSASVRIDSIPAPARAPGK